MNIENNTILILVVAVIGALYARVHYRREFIVNDGFAGLLYHEGKLLEALSAGRHVRWGRHYRVAFAELRKTLLPVAGQEVLTADNVSVKVSVVLTIQITDALKSAQVADNYGTHIYSAVQTAVRAVVAAVSIDALLTQRGSIGAQLQELIAPQAASLGVQLQAVEVRDVMLPAELRKAFSEVLKARQDGLGALERARGESASLRNLANAARLLEGLPALTTLRFLQTLESSKQTLVLNDLSILTAGLSARKGQKATES
ncbi:hypothetical protein BH09VER1_BH09VER1_13490 [soil metagenome]